MPVRPGLRLARAAAVCALAAGVGVATAARSQSLIEVLSTTYNSNPDLLAARALLRQTDETLAQAVANWRPQNHAVGGIQQARAGFLSTATSAEPTIRVEWALHDAADHPTALSRRQDGGRHQGCPGQHPGAARGASRHRAERPARRRDIVCRSRAEHRHRRCASQQRPEC